MLELVRQGKDVYFEGRKLTRVDQSSKGPNNEVIKIEGLPGANGQKWVSLRQLQEGTNQVNTKGKEVSATQTYTLNMVEKEEIDRLTARINEIKENARKRYTPKPKFVDPTTLNQDERENLAKQVENYLKSLRG